MIDNQTLIDECQELCAKGLSNEDIVKFLRAQGCSKVKSIAIIAKLLAVGLGEAKEIVHTSGTWADVRGRDDRFHASLERGLNRKDA